MKLPTVAPSSKIEDIVRAGRELNVETVMFGEVFKQATYLCYG